MLCAACVCHRTTYNAHHRGRAAEHITLAPSRCGRDEGFHQLFAHRFDPTIAANVLAHWMAGLHVHERAPHICTGTGALFPRPIPPHLRRDWGAPLPHLHQNRPLAAGAAACANGAWVPREQILGDRARADVRMGTPAP